MSNLFILPKPRSWEIFEDIVANVYSRKYESYNLQRYGRNGQAQDGLDIVGSTNTGLLGIQCKHHPDKKFPKKEIDDSIQKSEGFTPSLKEYVIATSASRDSRLHTYVLGISAARVTRNTYPVSIKFWEDICDWLYEYPDLIYKHFVQYFSLGNLENSKWPGATRLTRQTIEWPCTQEQLVDLIHKNLGTLHQVDPYNLFIGVSTFAETSFMHQVDIELPLAKFVSSLEESEANFQRAAEMLNAFKRAIANTRFSKQLIIYLQARLSIAFLLGWIFRRVTQYDLKLVFRDQVWTTSHLPYVSAKLYDEFPVVLNSNSNEAVLILNITRDIKSSVMNFISTWQTPPRVVLAYGVEGNVILSAAQALSLSQEISRKIKNLIDTWGITKIHLFPVMPTALATLISYHLNAICPIAIYFLHTPPDNYQLGGTLYRGL